MSPCYFFFAFFLITIIFLRVSYPVLPLLFHSHSHPFFFFSSYNNNRINPTLGMLLSYFILILFLFLRIFSVFILLPHSNIYCLPQQPNRARLTFLLTGLRGARISPRAEEQENLFGDADSSNNEVPAGPGDPSFGDTVVQTGGSRRLLLHGRY